MCGDAQNDRSRSRRHARLSWDFGFDLFQDVVCSDALGFEVGDFVNPVTYNSYSIDHFYCKCRLRPLFQNALLVSYWKHL